MQLTGTVLSRVETKSMTWSNMNDERVERATTDSGIFQMRQRGGVAQKYCEACAIILLRRTVFSLVSHRDYCTSIVTQENLGWCAAANSCTLFSSLRFHKSVGEKKQPMSILAHSEDRFINISLYQSYYSYSFRSMAQLKRITMNRDCRDLILS